MYLFSRRPVYAAIFVALTGQAIAESTLPPILISGFRTAEPGLDIPAATTIISQEEIRNSGARNLDQLLRRVPSIHVSDGVGGGGNSRIDMRGFGSTAQSNVAVLLNGRKINPASDQSQLYLNSIDLENVAQIEIIEGSAGILFGNQAVGGLINIITDRPDRRTRRASASVGSYDSYAVSATLNEPFENGGGLQLEGEYAESDNYRDRNASRVTRLNGRIDLENTGGTNRIELQWLDDNLQTPGALFADELAADRRQAFFPGDYQDTQSAVLLFGTDQTLNDHWNLEGEMSLRDDDREFVQSFRPFTPGDPPVAGSLSTQDREAIEFTPRLIGRFGDTVYTMGVDLLETDYDLETPDFLSFQRVDQTIWAAYAQVTHALSEKTSVTTGIRHADVENDIIDSFAGAADLDDDVTVGSLGLVHRPNDAWRLFVRADQNYRFAKVDEHTNILSGLQPVGIENQTGVSYETGASYSRENLQFSINAYLLELEDEISFADTGLGFFVNTNLPDTRRRGLTSTLDLFGGNGLSGGIGYSYVDSEITSGDFHGSEVPLVPPHRATAYLAFQPKKDAYARFDLEYVDEQFLGSDFNNTSPKLDDYTVVNLTAHHDFDDWRITAKVNNLFDERYVESGATSSVGDGFNPAPERNFWVGLSYSIDD